MVFASVRSPLEISVAVARTSQSPFPLCAILSPRLSNKTYEIFFNSELLFLLAEF